MAALLLFTGTTTGPARAQTQGDGSPSADTPPQSADPIGEPLRLGPPEEVDSAPPPDGTSQGGQDQSAGNSSQTSPRRAPEGIEVDQLDEMSLETLGVLDSNSGALGADMWAGTPRRRVEALLPRLPGNLDAPVLRDLARRLLLSPAVAPERQHAQGGTRDLLALRVDRLAAIGATDAVMRLIDALPRNTRSPGVLRHRVEALLLRHDREAACTAVRNAVRESDGAFWQKALALCQFADGAVAQADLTVRLLREQADPDQTGFLTLYEAATAGADRLPDGLPESLGPLELGLIVAGGLPFPQAPWHGLSVGALASLATAENGDLALRTRAAERSVALGILPPTRLGALYDRFTFPDGTLNAASQAPERGRDKMASVRRRALLYQAAQQEPSPAARAELFRQLLSERSPGAFIATARLLADALESIQVRPDLAWFAATAGRALYAADRPKAAGQWLRMAQQEAIINPKAAAAVTALWPYAMLSGADEVPANGGLAAWHQAQDGPDDAPPTQRESALRALLSALGQAPERSWVEVALDAPATPQPAPPAALLFALREAGEAGRRGETVLLTLLVLGPQGLGHCHPLALGSAVTALKQVGLDDTAHRLALQAAIYQGV
ncbi:hypothetical protein CKO21_14660 [Rhodovibrio salinarum]|uniref:Antifreeze glycopeptide polyprotein n=1 Tax=Rhodovibrio salinarum TaxID=1087 RepID=A0A934V0P2_9PROT|nr:hypothetical protein [Rhodovibrio salinarum]